MSTMPSKSKLQDIRNAMQKALDQVAKTHNLQSVKLGNLTYDESSFRMSLEAVFQGGETREMADLRRHAAMYGFNPEIAGAEIQYGSKTYKVIGVKRTNFSLQSLTDGKVYDARIDIILDNLKRQKSPFVLIKTKTVS